MGQHSDCIQLSHSQLFHAAQDKNHGLRRERKNRTIGSQLAQEEVKVESHQLEVLPTGEAAAHRAQQKAAEKAVEASKAAAMQQEQSDLTKAILQSKVHTSKQGAHLPHNALCT